MNDTSKRPAGGLLAPAVLLSAAVSTLLLVLLWRPAYGLELYGWDTYPLILAGRFESLGGALATLGEELMDGHFPLGRFYRPLTSFSIGLDHALGGLEPSAYHRTDLLALLLSAMLVGLLARELLGAGKPAAALASAAYLLHPIHFAIVPLVPRRADGLAVTFTLAALVFAARPGRLRVVLTTLACLAALASKETGAVATAAVLALVFLSEPGSARERARAALARGGPALAVLALFLVLRTIVLGGLGGSPRASLAGGLLDLPAVVGRTARLLLAPQPWFPESAEPWIAGVIGAGLVLLLVASRRCPVTEPGASGSARPGTFLFVWFALLAVLTGLSGLHRAWYTLAFLPILVLALARLADAGLSSLRSGSVRLGAAALVLVLAAVSLQGLGLGFSSRWVEVQADARAAQELSGRFLAALATQEPGTSVRLDGAPPGDGAIRRGERTQRTLVLPPYALEALARLELDEGRADRVRVVVAGRNGADPVGPDELRVELVPAGLVDDSP